MRRAGVGADRILIGCVVVIAIATAVLHAVGARPNLSWMWGVHFYVFYPLWVLVVATAALAAVVLTTIVRPKALADAVTNALRPALEGRLHLAFAAACIVAGALLFWFARISHTYLGDGNIIVEEIDTSRQLLEREPLSSLLQYAVYRTTKSWFHDPNRSIELNAQDALAPGSVLAGFFFLMVAWFLASELARLVKTDEDRHTRVITALVWLTVVAQGYVQLFFGYIENYSFYAVGVVAYLWLALRHLRGAAPLLFPALALILCFALHLSSLVLGASFVVLAACALAHRESRLRALRDLGVAIAICFAVVFAFSRVREGYNPLMTLLGMVKTAFAHESSRAYMFSSQHYRDFFNEQLLIGPLGMFLFLPAAAAAVRAKDARRHPAAWFVLVAGLGFLVACWLIGDSNLGYARDWDLLSHSGLVFTTASLVLLLLPRVRHTVVVSALVCAAATSLYHTTPWIAVNADEPRSVARLQTLPLGLGRTEVVVSTYYRQRGDTENQRVWLQRALVTNPNNVNAIYLLGALDLKSGRYEDAVVSLEQAVRMRPDKVMFRTALVQALSALNRLQEAIPHLEMLARNEGNSLLVQITLGEALRGTGRIAEAQRAFEQAERLCRPIVDANPGDPRITVAHGFTLMRLGRLDEAERQLTRAIALDPNLADAHCFLGYVMRDQGRPREATQEFDTCLALNPAFGGRLEIEEWLSHNRPRTP
ncbi:MAG TPA: tetratricopeptide repeat protein [Candidatus Krumholzibacteria bacterium]|nr:tetratricopeptide repeat protein [Candidatus Krumholzibacteria bacterium]